MNIDDLITLKEAAANARLSVSTVRGYSILDNFPKPVKKIGATLLYIRSEMGAYLADKKSKRIRRTADARQLTTVSNFAKLHNINANILRAWLNDAGADMPTPYILRYEKTIMTLFCIDELERFLKERIGRHEEDVHNLCLRDDSFAVWDADGACCRDGRT